MDERGLATQEGANFPLREARRLVKDLFVPKPSIYWLDFLFHVMLGWSAFLLTLKSPLFSPSQLFFYAVTALALYRAVIFTHEIAHLKRNTFRSFRLTWNITCGFPLMVPSFMYQGVHNEHHKRAVYGTKKDGEYLAFAAEPPYKIVAYLLMILVLPLVLAGRFIILTPVSYVYPKLRPWLWARASSLTIDMSYRRPESTSGYDKTWRLQEFSTFLIGVTAVSLTIAGVLPYQVLLLWYLVTVLIFLLNSLRTLAAHRYRNHGRHPMTLAEQYLDSVNIPGTPLLTPLWAPVGLRFHATHHLFPGMPYHALGEAHRRLVKDLPGNALYLRTIRKGLFDALRSLWHESSQVRMVARQAHSLTGNGR